MIKYFLPTFLLFTHCSLLPMQKGSMQEVFSDLGRNLGRDVGRVIDQALNVTREAAFVTYVNNDQVRFKNFVNKNLANVCLCSFIIGIINTSISILIPSPTSYVFLTIGVYGLANALIYDRNIDITRQQLITDDNIKFFLHSQGVSANPLLLCTSFNTLYSRDLASIDNYLGLYYLWQHKK